MREWVVFFAPDIAGVVVGLVSIAALYLMWRYEPYLGNGNVERLERERTDFFAKAREGRVRALAFING